MNKHNPIKEGADPFILVHEGKYYLYSTELPDGFKVFSSTDLINFNDEGYALKKGENVIGEWGFWAPEIMFENGIFYMVYVCDEHLAIATSKSPKGPFKQDKITYISDEKMIDGHFFKDDDGQIYLFYVKFDNANVLYAAKMNDDLTTFIPETETFILRSEEPWESITDYKVMEGPFVLKHHGKYYMSYSCNHCESQDYAIGYAVSDKPLGPYKRFKGNPILKKNDIAVGVGHHSFFNRIEDNHLMIVYHRHYSFEKPFPRWICIDEAQFIDDQLVINGPTY